MTLTESDAHSKPCPPSPVGPSRHTGSQTDKQRDSETGKHPNNDADRQ